MSVRILSLVFEADIKDLEYTKKNETRIAKASTVNCLLLAYADHSNDEGEGGYPSYTRLERKTKLSRQGIADTLDACTQNNFLTFEGKSKRETNSYRLNIELLATLNTPLYESSHLTSVSQATLLVGVKPLDLNHPKPSNDIRFSEVAQKLSELTGGLNSKSADVIGAWLEKHTNEWIFKAIEMAQVKGARNAGYVDAILIGWEANGYPQTRDEKIKGAKYANNRTSNSKRTDETPAEYSADDRAAAEYAKKLKAERRVAVS